MTFRTPCLNPKSIVTPRLLNMASLVLQTKLCDAVRSDESQMAKIDQIEKQVDLTGLETPQDAHNAIIH